MYTPGSRTDSLADAFIARMEAEHDRKQRIEQRNRINASHSTGPRTEEGKAASSQNSLKHGIYARKEDFDTVLHMQAHFLEDFDARTAAEVLVIEQMAEHWVRMKRYRKLEQQLLDSPSWEICQMTAVVKFLNSAERSFHRCLATVRSLIAERRKQEQQAAAANEAAAAAAAKQKSGFVPPQRATTPERPSDSGFVPPANQNTTPPTTTEAAA